MKIYKEMGFGLFVITGILLAGCNDQQQASQKAADLNESIQSDENVQAEESKNSNTEQSVKEMYIEKLSLAKKQAVISRQKDIRHMQ